MIANLTRGVKTASLPLPADRFQIAEGSKDSRAFLSAEFSRYRDSVDGLLRHSVDDASDVLVHADRSVGNLVGTEHLAAVDTGISRAGISRCHLPKGIFDDDGRVVADAEFEKQYLLPLSCVQEVCIPLRRRVPTLVLNKPVV